MTFRTIVDVPPPPFRIEPLEEMLFVGSCFADSIGRRFADEHFRATVNPYGTMYNPVSVLHTVERVTASMAPSQDRLVVFLTLGTNHVYRLRETGEVVDNCQKRPQRLFQEEELSVEACADALDRAVDMLRQRRPNVQVVLTVSPIRYAKYGYHGSQLSKATLLLAADRLCQQHADGVTYFPAYELLCDDLRDYRFYQPDMLHPAPQAVEYIWERLADTYLSDRARQFLAEWKPIRQALGHRPFHPDSTEYQAFLADARRREQQLLARYAPPQP